MKYNLYSINSIFKAYNLKVLRYVWTWETNTRIKIIDISIIPKRLSVHVCINSSLPMLLLPSHQTTTNQLCVTKDYDTKGLECSYTAGRNVTWHTHFGKLFGNFSKIKHTPMIWPRHSIVMHLSKIHKAYILRKACMWIFIDFLWN